MIAKFISTIDIKNNSWQIRNYDKNFNSTPPSDKWLFDSLPQINDIHIWEEIYYDPGVIGIYAAWDPYCEFYIIDYPFIKDTDKRFQLFHGFEASGKIQEIVKSYGILIPSSVINVD